MRKNPRGWIQIGESHTRGVARIQLGLKPSRDSRATSQRDSPIWIQPLGVFHYISMFSPKFHCLSVTSNNLISIQQHSQINLFSSEARIFLDDKINTMAVDDLAPCVIKRTMVMALTMIILDKQVFVFSKEVFHASVSSQWQKMHVHIYFSSEKHQKVMGQSSRSRGEAIPLPGTA